jgi:hypothetical protein
VIGRIRDRICRRCTTVESLHGVKRWDRLRQKHVPVTTCRRPEFEGAG